MAQRYGAATLVPRTWALSPFGRRLRAVGHMFGVRCSSGLSTAVASSPHKAQRPIPAAQCGPVRPRRGPAAHKRYDESAQTRTGDSPGFGEWIASAEVRAGRALTRIGHQNHRPSSAAIAGVMKERTTSVSKSKPKPIVVPT